LASREAKPMTEAEWLACTDPNPMLKLLGGKVSDRKLRLFAVACARRVLHLATNERSHQAIEVAERHAEGMASGKELAAAMQTAPQGTAARACARASARSAAQVAARIAGWAVAWFTPTSISGKVATWDAEREALKASEGAVQCGLLQDIFGPLPFRPVEIHLAWLNPTELVLAQAAYDNRSLPAGTLDPTRLAVLSDALEEGGCDNADILAHLRSPGLHVRGCFAVDLALGRE
jgi:hypothetical protein